MKYTIPKETELIIVNLYGTMISTQGENSSAAKHNIPRNHLKNFLERYKASSRKLVVFTDQVKKETEEILRNNGTLDYFDKLYTYENSNIDLSDFTNPGIRPLTKACKDFSISPEHTVFIGDSDRDKKSAIEYDIKFIRVPEYRTQEENTDRFFKNL